MTQHEARKLAKEYRDRGEMAIATTRDELAGRWEKTYEWVVVLPGRIIDTLPQEAKGK